jgi:DNA sulfur modification protein DndD
LALSGLGFGRRQGTACERGRARALGERKSQGDSNLERFLASVEFRHAGDQSGAERRAAQGVLDSARGAWEKLWHPPPDNCADEYLHPYLNELERSKVIDRLDELDELGAPAIVELLST